MQVADVMSRELVVLPKTASVAAGLKRAADRDIHHVLIAGESPGSLAGIACICQLRERPPQDALGTCISRAPVTIPPEATLKDAATRFVASGLCCFPVSSGESVLGVVTRSDLRTGGLSDAELPASFACSFCGSTRHVRTRPEDETLAACLECADRMAPASAGLYDEGTKD